MIPYLYAYRHPEYITKTAGAKLDFLRGIRDYTNGVLTKYTPHITGVTQGAKVNTIGRVGVNSLPTGSVVAAPSLDTYGRSLIMNTLGVGATHLGRKLYTTISTSGNKSLRNVADKAKPLLNFGEKVYDLTPNALSPYTIMGNAMQETGKQEMITSLHKLFPRFT